MRTAKLILVMLLAGAAFCQAPPPTSVSVTVRLDTITKLWEFFFGVRTTITLFSCDRSATSDDPLLPGEFSTCTVTLNQPAGRRGVTVQVTVPVPLNGGPSGGTVVIPPGATSGSFVVTYPSTGAALTMPAAYTVWGPGMETQYIAEFLWPCCAREDHCGVPIENVAMELCQ